MDSDGSKSLSPAYGKIRRTTIDYICSKVPTPPSVDGISGEHAKKNIISGFVKQLSAPGIRFDQTQTKIDALAEEMIQREEASRLKDNVRYGLRASEAMTVGLGNALQKLFSSVNKKSTKILETVRELDRVLRTTLKRKGETITCHFDRAWVGSLTLQEMNDMKSIFVNTTIADLLLRNKANSNRGYIVGILQDFPGDGVRPDLREFRRVKAEFDAIESIPVRPWDKAAMGTTGKDYMMNCIMMIRIFFDADLLYARKITMSKLVNVLFGTVSREKIAYIVASSGKHAIIDIFPNIPFTSGVSQYDGEGMYLQNTLPFTFNTLHVTGVSGIESLNIVQVELKELISFGAINEYYASVAGRELYLQEIREYYGMALSVKDIETKSFFIPRAELRETDYPFVNFGDVILAVRLDDFYSLVAATEDQLTKIFIFKLLDPQNIGNIDDIWVCQLDHLKIFKHSISLELLTEMFDYCGLEIVRETFHETLVGITDKIYVRSPTGIEPSTIIELHMNATNYTYTQLSNFSLQARRRVEERAKATNISVSKLLEIPEVLELQRIFKYFYCVMGVGKRKSSKNENPIPEHIESHPFWQVLHYPFVDKTKSVCGDWHTMTYLFGTIIARNNYLVELQELYSAQNIDKRVLELYADYVFEFGDPAGIGYYASKKHNVGIISSISQEQPEKQLVSIAHTKPPESMKMLAPSFMMGMLPISGSIAGKSYEERTVDIFTQRREELRYRISKQRILGISPVETQAEDQNLDFLVHTRLLETDPFVSIPTFTISGETNIPKYPSSLLLSRGTIKHDVSSMLRQINEGAEKIHQRLVNTIPLEIAKPKVIEITGDFVDIISVYAYIKSLETVNMYRGAF